MLTPDILREAAELIKKNELSYGSFFLMHDGRAPSYEEIEKGCKPDCFCAIGAVIYVAFEKTGDSIESLIDNLFEYTDELFLEMQEYQWARNKKKREFSPAHLYEANDYCDDPAEIPQILLEMADYLENDKITVKES